MHLLWKHYFQSHLENGASQEEWREGAKEKDGRWSDGISADEKHQGECLWQEEEGDQKDERPAKVSDEEELAGMLSSKEKKIKKSLQKSLGMK